MKLALLLPVLLLAGCYRETIYVYNERGQSVPAANPPTDTQSPSLTVLHADNRPYQTDPKGPRTIVVRKYLGPPPRWWEPDDRPLPTVTRCPDGVLLVTEWVYGNPPAP